MADAPSQPSVSDQRQDIKQILETSKCKAGEMYAYFFFLLSCSCNSVSFAANFPFFFDEFSWYIISTRWFRNWQTFVQYDENRTGSYLPSFFSSGVDLNRSPGSIDNTDIAGNSPFLLFFLKSVILVIGMAFR